MYVYTSEVLFTNKSRTTLWGLNIEPMGSSQNLGSKLTNQKTAQFTVRSTCSSRVTFISECFVYTLQCYWSIYQQLSDPLFSENIVIG